MTRHRLLIAVTSDQSLVLMTGWPEHLARQGWEVHVVCSPGPKLSELTKLRLPHVTTHGLHMRRDPAAVHDLRALVHWFRLLRSLRPHALILGTPKAALLGMLAGVVLRVPLRVYQLRGLRGETVRGNRRRVLNALERLTARCAHSVIAVSPSLARLYIAAGLSAEGKVTVLGAGSSNGVDLDRFRVRSSTSRSEEVVVGFVGRLAADKGLSVLRAAEEQLVLRGVPHELLLVGGTDRPADGPVTWPRGSRVREVGHVSDTSPVYADIDILVLPTYREGFPNVVLEASASGIPTVTTDATGAVDSVIDGVTGTIVPVGDGHALADALEDLVRDEARRAAFGSAARKHVEASFARDLVWRLYDAHLRTLMRDRVPAE